MANWAAPCEVGTAAPQGRPRSLSCFSTMSMTATASRRLRSLGTSCSKVGRCPGLLAQQHFTVRTNSAGSRREHCELLTL